jgi:hypothetical protein
MRRLLAFLDPWLGRAPLIIETHYRPAGQAQVRDDKAHSRKQLALMVFDLGDDFSRLRPAHRSVREALVAHQRLVAGPSWGPEQDLAKEFYKQQESSAVGVFIRSTELIVPAPRIVRYRRALICIEDSSQCDCRYFDYKLGRQEAGFLWATVASFHQVISHSIAYQLSFARHVHLLEDQGAI